MNKNKYELVYTLDSDPMSTRHTKTVDAIDEDDAKDIVAGGEYDDVTFIEVTLIEE